MRIIADLYLRNKKYKVIMVFLAVSIVENLFIGHLFARYDDLENTMGIESMENAQPKKSASEIIQRPTIEYQAEDFRDPFTGYLDKAKKVPKDTEETQEVLPPALAIQGIVWGSNLPQAIINNKVVKVGDTIEGSQIVNIDKNGVVVLYLGKQFTLSSPGEISRQGIPKKP